MKTRNTEKQEHKQETETHKTINIGKQETRNIENNNTETGNTERKKHKTQSTEN